ncbi:MAG: hypothetical protein LUE27_11140 [Clostridia bacterium]|nr:hypothetical protein [Clostridia bacterium]
MAQIKYYDKRVGVTYVYDSKSYYDEASGKYKAKRTLIGKLDPDTGALIPTGRRGRPSCDKQAGDAEGTDYKALYEKTMKELEQKNEWAKLLEGELASAKKELKEAKRALKEISRICRKDEQDS